MKDFEWENTENTMNENTDPVNENREPVAGPASEENVREDDVEDILRHAQETSRPQEAAPAQPAQDSLRTTQNAWSAAPSYQDAQPAQNRSAQGTAYSPYPNGAYRPQQNPYAANPQNGAYRPAQGYNPQNRSYNAYGASYDPQTASSRISYQTPVKKQKTKKSGSVKAVAILCACAVILSGLAGFGGSVLGNRLTAANKVTAAESDSTQKTTAAAQTTGGEPVVIYKSVDVDSVATSTSATAGSDLTYAQVAALVKDSVVEIKTEMAVTNPYFPQFVQQATGAGSGVIISEDGYLITNAHVILNENTGSPAETVTVRLTNGEEYKAEVITYDSDEDIAILKINATGLTPARCGDSDRLVVGEEILVVGNPLGELGGSVSNGIISATQREIEIGGVTMSLIQTNAAVNPGNSGGGMFNMKGEFVGIVNCKSYGEEIEGLGFAIPINQALKVSEELLTKGYVSGKPMLGITLDDVSNQSNSFFFFYSIRSGLYVTAVTEGMNDKVFKVGDRIIAVDGEEVSSRDDVKTILYKHAVGDKIKVQLYRDNKLMEVEATLYERVPTAEQSGTFGEADVQGSLSDFFGGNN